MNDVQSMMYDELVALRTDLKEYMEKMDKRVHSLENFRDRMMGVLIAIGVGIRYAWDYCKERIL